MSGHAVWQPLDAARVYAHIKPSGLEAALETELPQLRPRLRPYQLRAAAWMVARECSSHQVPCMHLFLATA